ncbi:hypothetical protein HK105_200078 [Polyrhizophydium stewartii]|uniref:Male-enhanced antigen 1 n=1 Tax=Polyrhizophydium stewartii TaxID=2732419 RepID=A0ABR4NKF9_9FUNG
MLAADGDAHKDTRALAAGTWEASDGRASPEDAEAAPGRSVSSHGDRLGAHEDGIRGYMLGDGGEDDDDDDGDDSDDDGGSGGGAADGYQLLDAGDDEDHESCAALEGGVHQQAAALGAPTPSRLVLERDDTCAIPQDDLALIQQVMASISLPEVAIPEWAKRVPESAWMPVFSDSIEAGRTPAAEAHPEASSQPALAQELI